MASVAVWTIAPGRGEPKSPHTATLAVASEELPKWRGVGSTWKPISIVASRAAVVCRTSRHHQCVQEAEVAMTGLLLGVNHTSLCKGSYSNMFIQVSAARPLTTWLLWPLFIKFKLGLGAGENSQQPQTALLHLSALGAPALAPVCREWLALSKVLPTLTCQEPGGRSLSKP